MPTILLRRPLQPLIPLLLAICVLGNGASADDRPRLLVLTDIGGDPDDQQSLIRLLAHSDEFRIEGLVASASGTPGELKEHVTRPELIRQLVDAYGEVEPNLRQHAEGFPAVESLRAVIRAGNRYRGRDAIGEGHDSEGSRWIMECVDRDEPQPLNITIWGGQTDFAQACWRVREDRGEQGFRDWAEKLRVYDISDQDRIHDWMFEQFPSVFYVLSQSPPGIDKREGGYRGMYLGGDESLTSREWIDSHVRNGHGPLGALYPVRTWTAPNPHGVLKEGDTPSWFCFLRNGLNDPAHPEWGGWGGRFRHEAAGLWRDAKDTVDQKTEARATVYRWRAAYQHAFAVRMDWCATADVRAANHFPVARLNGDGTHDILQLTTSGGKSVALDAAGSTDPDGDELQYAWWIYEEPGSDFRSAPSLHSDGPRATLMTPDSIRSGSVHVILEVTDNGEPPLTSYRRAVVEIR